MFFFLFILSYKDFSRIAKRRNKCPNNLFAVKSCIPMSMLCINFFFHRSRIFSAIRHSVCGNIRELMNIHEFWDFFQAIKFPFLYSYSFLALLIFQRESRKWVCVFYVLYVSDLSVSLVCSITYCTLDGLDLKYSLITW